WAIAGSGASTRRRRWRSTATPRPSGWPPTATSCRTGPPPPGCWRASEHKRTMRTVALEEHYATTEFLNGPEGWLAWRPGIVEPISDLGDGRIAAMDEAGVDLAVLSLAAPGVEQLDGPAAVRLARSCNDELAAAVGRYPDRLAGFATLPTSAPEAAAEELERAVRQHGFPGAVINGHSQGRYLDNPFFE